MTTFDIDNTKKTKHLEILEGLVEHGHSLRATHNPQTWRLSALTFALHLHDCITLFKDVKERWGNELPFYEAWDVDMSEWKNEVWSLVNDVSSFTENIDYNSWEKLCEKDYESFILKAQECLDGELPLNDIIAFLEHKRTDLKRIIVDCGQELSSLFSEIESMLYNSSSILYEEFYNKLLDIYRNENPELMIETDDGQIPYNRWKASKPTRRLPENIKSKIKSSSTSVSSVKFWRETWEECFDSENREIDKEGFARFVFNNRNKIIGSKSYPVKSCLEKCISSLWLCEFLWSEYDRLQNPETNSEILKNKIYPDIKILEDYINENYSEKYTRIWDKIFSDENIVKLMKDVSPNGFTGGYNKKLVCNIVGLMSYKQVYNKNNHQLDEILYVGTTCYKYINNINTRSTSTDCVISNSMRQIIEGYIDNP